ncbi:GntR family transcriptional regulator [Saccharopolyspora sp. NPDC050389]|uniref:GntR family transcriptional regulator n=1 Tax=Saccharopolyspora sp. NPDC050389 TaxID=3155516 RepID=UPI0034094D7B
MAKDAAPVRDRTPMRKQLSEEVASYVRELIASGDVRPGEFLRMEPIAEAIGVSTTPVREGLLSLRSEGFIRLVPRRGFVVAHFSRQDVRDLFWGQAQLAGEPAARAAKKITPDRLDELDAIVEQHAKAIAVGAEDRIAALGHAFHRNGGPEARATLETTVQ